MQFKLTITITKMAIKEKVVNKLIKTITITNDKVESVIQISYFIFYIYLYTYIYILEKRWRLGQHAPESAGTEACWPKRTSA
jgi:hypothetical protein